ncbi:hypothetical protein DFJ73DRAFT_395017 [Zopfochytrium polystomum]|nr:hypothetical protein DFJ73DRAFT_395017 [Zopfochytrium polystomum]
MTSSVRQQGAPPHGRGPAAAAAAAAAAATAAPVPPMRSSSSNGDLAPSGSSKHFMGWSCADVLAWIRTLPNLDESMRQRAIDAFTENDIDGATMASLSKQDLKDELGIQSLGLRSKVIFHKSLGVIWT